MTRNCKRTSMILIAFGLISSFNCWGETKVKIAPGSANGNSGTLAVIDGKPITVDIFRAEMARRQGDFDGERKGALLDSMVRSELLFAAARNEKYENDPEVIAQVKQVMVGKYLRDNLEPKLAQLKATEQETEAYYYAHPAEFGSQAMVHAALIRIAVSPKATVGKRAELLKRAESARVEALALEPGVPAFGSVAVKYSEEQDSRYRGGDIGWLQTGPMDGRWDKKVTDAIFALKAPGQVSPVIAATDGYYIVKLVETKGATVRPLAEVKEGVRYQVIQEKRKKV
jgi:peptidyl-prolyl cis-trans isomerase C